jgi:hypothetical protein
MYLEWPNRIWATSLDLKKKLRFFETFCEYAPCNNLCGSTNVIIFGHMDQKLWVFENFRRSLGKASMCYSQPARVDYISPKRWAARIRRFEKSPLTVSAQVF